MRGTILYLANHWTEFEMLLTPHRFLYLVMYFPIEMRVAAKHALPIMLLLPLFFLFSPSERTKWRSKSLN